MDQGLQGKLAFVMRELSDELELALIDILAEAEYEGNGVPHLLLALMYQNPHYTGACPVTAGSKGVDDDQS